MVHQSPGTRSEKRRSGEAEKRRHERRRERERERERENSKRELAYHMHSKRRGGVLFERYQPPDE